MWRPLDFFLVVLNFAPGASLRRTGDCFIAKRCGTGPTLDLLSRIASGIRSPPCRPPPSPCLLMANAAPRQNAADAWLSVRFRLRRRSRLAVARARNHRPAKRRVTPPSRRRRRRRPRASPPRDSTAPSTLSWRMRATAETSPPTIPPSLSSPS